MSDYWNTRYGSGGMVWGDKPSGTAELAKVVFKKYKKEEVLVIGSGYGRNSDFFYDEGFYVEGVEYSEEGIRLAKATNKDIVYYHGSFFELPFNDRKYSAIYCYNVIHLFKKDSRMELLKKCNEVLGDKGIMYFTGFSELEDSFGKGEKLEYNTFETKKGKLIHFYSAEDIIEEFNGFRLVDTGLYEEKENHGDEGEHKHILRYIIVEKNNEVSDSTR